MEWPGAADDQTLGVVNFCTFPHPDVFPDNSMGHAEEWAAQLKLPAYVLDDQSAIHVVDGRVKVVSEGKWRRLP